MARVGEVNLDPKNPMTIVDTLNRVVQVVDQEIEFGDPSDPYDVTSGTIADGVTHNGRLSNIRGSWVELEIASSLPARIYTHNLNLPVHNNGSFDEPNVRWFCTNIRHDGTGFYFNSEDISFEFVEGRTVTANSIDLVMRFGFFRTINASHPLKVTMFFVPAVRWP